MLQNTRFGLILLKMKRRNPSVCKALSLPGVSFFAILQAIKIHLYMNTLLRLIIAILVITALVLGFLIFKAKYPSASSESSTSVQTTEEVIVTGGIENAILVLSSPNSTPAEKEAYAAFVKETAIPATVIDVTSCSPKPLAASVKQGSLVNFSNTGTEKVMLVFNKDLSLEITAGETKSIVASFKQGPAVYGYGCGASPYAVGELVIVE